MNAAEQARGEILLAFKAWRRDNAKDDDDLAPLSALADDARLSVSMLYQFMREGGPLLGTASVNKLRPLLDKYLDVPTETWLAVMGVGAAPVVEAQA